MTVRAEQLLEHRALDPRERLEALCDPGSLKLIRTCVKSPALGARARAGDGVLGASGRVHGRPIVCFAEDAGFAGGSLGSEHAETIVRVMDQAARARVPIVGLVESGGARIQEGVAALAGYARIFRRNVELSGLVPQISVLTGVSAGGGCYSPALTDFVVMVEDASMFLTGPAVVRDAVGEEISREDLGGPRVHERNGVCQLVAATDLEAILRARQLLGYLPQHSCDQLPLQPPEDPEFDDPAEWLPERAAQTYDVRKVIRSIVDEASVLEIAPKWARNVVTAFCRIDGRPVGVIANQPRHLGGVLCADSAQKAARFVRTCNSYGLPLMVLVDTPGFLPGSKQEHVGVIRHGAKLVHAFAEATVPKVSIVMRKAYGGAYITMNARDLGADYAFAWPGAEIGIMAARQAVQIVHRRELAVADDAERDRLVEQYARERLDAEVACRQGFIDELIEPAETRARVCAAFDAFAATNGGQRPHVRNIPL